MRLSKLNLFPTRRALGACAQPNSRRQFMQSGELGVGGAKQLVFWRLPKASFIQRKMRCELIECNDFISVALFAATRYGVCDWRILEIISFNTPDRVLYNVCKHCLF